MTAFISDKAPKKGRNQTAPRNFAPNVDLASPSSPGNLDDDEAFEESIRFVSMTKKGSSVSVPDEDANVANASSAKILRAPTSTRPLPRKKKRKSDEIDASSDNVAVNDLPAAATDVHGGSDDDLSSRLKAHKRFKRLHELQGGADKGSENDADETSSLTSLSKGPSSEAENNDQQEDAPRGLRVKRGRSGRAMQVVYSSDAEEMALEAELAANDDADKDPVVPPPSSSSIVADSQPWHQLHASLVERVRLQPDPGMQHLQSEKLADIGPNAVQQAVGATGRQDSGGNPAEQLPVEDDAEPDLDMDTESTQPLEAPKNLGLPSGGRSLVREESRTFPFPFGMATRPKAPVLRQNSSVSLSSLRHSEPSQADFAVPQYIPPTREALAAKYRREIPSLTEDDFESMALQQGERIPTKAMPGGHGKSDVFQEDSSTQQSETVDFYREMRKMLPPPPKQPEQPQVQTTTTDPGSVARHDTVVQHSEGAQVSTPLTSPPVSDPPVQADTGALAPDVAGHVSVDGTTTGGAFLHDAAAEDASLHTAERETETMLPLTLDTQLHRPGILSPNFQLRRKDDIVKAAQPRQKNETTHTPTKKQRFASPLVTPGKTLQTPRVHGNVSRTPAPHGPSFADPSHRSPESMVENVETLATWSPAKFSTSYQLGYVNGQTQLAGQGKENMPFISPEASQSKSHPPQSPDEVVSSIKA